MQCLRYLVLVPCGLAWSAASLAQTPPIDNWFIGSTADDEVFLFVDANTLRDREDPSLTIDAKTYKSAWVTVVNEGEVAAEDKFAWSKSLDFVDCSNDRLSTKTSTTYRLDGSVTGTATEDVALDWRDVIPGTVGAMEEAFICAAAGARLSNENWHDIGTGDPSQFARILFLGSPRTRSR